MTDDASVYRYVRLFTDEGGTARFEDVEVTLETRQYAPPAPPLPVGALAEAAGPVVIISGDRGWRGDVSHPTPRRQLFCVLAGSFVITVGDGVRRQFDQGSLILLEDTWGDGHTTEFVTDRIVVAAIPLTE